VIYEVHVKGFTARRPDMPEELRGTQQCGVLASGTMVLMEQRVGKSDERSIH
jgi:hypothetical protein